MNLALIALVVLFFLFLSGLPAWGYSRDWGYGPSGGVLLVLVIVFALWLLGRL